MIEWPILSIRRTLNGYEWLGVQRSCFVTSKSFIRNKCHSDTETVMAWRFCSLHSIQLPFISYIKLKYKFIFGWRHYSDCFYFLFFIYRFPGNVLCVYALRHRWARQNMGTNTILWSIHLCFSQRSSKQVIRVHLSYYFAERFTCDLYPFRLLELVEDCGPLPIANDRCKLDTERTNKTAPFPYCCPKFTCEPGVKLEYPEIKTEAPTTDKN